ELESLQRDLHTLKGGARMAEIREIGDLAHELEYLYEDLGQGRLRAGGELFQLLLTCHDRLAQMLEAVRDNQPLPDGTALIETIKRYRSNPDEQLSIPSSIHLKTAIEEQQREPEADILSIFVEEGDDLLQALDQALNRWGQLGHQREALDEMLRVLHTLKGGARLAGQRQLGDLAHDLEQRLSEAQQQGEPWPDSLTLDIQSGIEGLNRELDALRGQVSEAPAPAPQAVAPATPMVAPVSLITASEQPQQSLQQRVLPFVERARKAAEEAAAHRAPQEMVKVPADLLEEL